MGLYQGDNLLSSIGKSPAAYAKDNGYTGTDDEFYSALADMPGHLDNKENPHGVTAAQVGADASGAAATALANAKSYTDQEVANATPGTATKDSPTGADSLFLYDAADSNKPKKTLISKVADLFKNTFYTKDETSTLLQNKAPAGFGYGESMPILQAASGTESEADFGAKIDNILDTMQAGSTKQVKSMAPWMYAKTYSLTTIYKYDDTRATVIADGCHVSSIDYGWKFTKDNGMWMPHEWINPPMELGKEYRTTERFLAKPVYQVAFEISELPAAGSTVSKELPVTYSTISDIKIIGLEGGLLKQGISFIGLSATDPAHYTNPYSKGWWAYPRENKVYVYSLINLAEVLADGTPKYDKFIIVAKYVRGSF